MVPLIDCSESDAERYYRGVVVYHGDKAYIFSGRRGDTAVLVTKNGVGKTVPYKEVLLCLVDPFYTKRGDWLGLQVRRDSRRGLTLSQDLLPEVETLVQTGNLPPSEHGRLNKDFFLGTYKGVTVLRYRGSVVGFMNKERDLYVQDTFIQERLTKLGLANVKSIRVFTQSVTKERAPVWGGTRD